ncbi:MAG: hypothetical protein HY820_24455 [Acidobacteria bacterium]|nr:hypothetical protein [Acidobacteriota bacterium]
MTVAKANMLRFFLLMLVTLTLWAAGNFKLYLKDGTYHIVREYQIVEDRVRYYSVERSDWEELPLELADLKKTKEEIRDVVEKTKEQAKLLDEEDKAEREARREAAGVPEGEGAYFVDGKEIKTMKRAEMKVNNNKRRQVWQVLSPIPIVSGKATVELDGDTSAFVIKTATPEFYFRPSQPERFGIFKLTPGKNIRIVEKLDIMPVTKEVVENQEVIETYQRQMGDGLYKVWPAEPLPPGEYAMVQYTTGKVNLQIWDFSVRK